MAKTKEPQHEDVAKVGMRYGLKILEFANGDPTELSGMYVRTFDPEANAGRGALSVASAERDALAFETAEDAMAFWKNQGVGVRPDGRPNRPLTAFTVVVCPLGRR